MLHQIILPKISEAAQVQSQHIVPALPPDSCSFLPIRGSKISHKRAQKTQRKVSADQGLKISHEEAQEAQRKIILSQIILPKRFVILSVIFLFSLQVLSRRLRGWVRIPFFTIRVYLRNPRSYIHLRLCRARCISVYSRLTAFYGINTRADYKGKLCVPANAQPSSCFYRYTASFPSATV